MKTETWKFGESEITLPKTKKNEELKIKKSKVNWGKAKHYKFEYSVVPMTLEFSIGKKKSKIEMKMETQKTTEVKKKRKTPNARKNGR